MVEKIDNQTITTMAVKLVQPGKISDVTEGVLRLLSQDVGDREKIKSGVQKQLVHLIEAGLVEKYTGGRYVLSANGEAFIESTGIRYLIDARRMYLLKETRKLKSDLRSDTRNRSLRQRSKV